MSEDVKDRKLPGGSLLAAYLDRQLMIWSDRGGASRHIGDRWAAHCSAWIDNALNEPWPIPDAEPLVINTVLRLDDVPEVSREANHYHLENPDFLLVGVRPEAADHALVMAVDAKFAADRIRPSQVSAQIVENLVTIPETGVTRQLLEDALRDHDLETREFIDGAFLCPESTLTTFLLKRRSRAREEQNGKAEIVTIPPDPANMFAGLPASNLIGALARIDRLPVTPRENLLSAIYYFRVACACIYLWQEQHRPLFTIREAEPPEIGLVSAEVSLRAQSAHSAYEVMMGMVDDAEVIQRARQSIANVASLPLRMTEIRALLQETGREDKSLLRALRRDLELEFQRRLFDRVGEIPADDPRPLGEILDEVAAAARGLRAHMSAFANERVRVLTAPSSSAANG